MTRAAADVSDVRTAKPETHTALVRRARKIYRELADVYPYVRCELDFENPYQLLTAVILSAQSTDVGVNKVTPALFRKYPTPADLAAADPEELEAMIKTTGFFHNKAKSLLGMSKALVENFDGKVPRKLEQMVTLPGVGRKTANVVLNTAFGEETFAVDTHVFRVCNRTGLAPGRTVDEVEVKLEKIVPQPFRRDAHHWLILHGRYTCRARLPECWRCPVIDLCRYKPKTPPPGERVKPSGARTGRQGKSATRIAKARTASTPKAGRSRSRPNRLP